MHEKQHQNTASQLMDNAYKLWGWYNMLKSLTKDFLSTDLGQQLMAWGALLLGQLDFEIINSYLNSAISMFR